MHGNDKKYRGYGDTPVQAGQSWESWCDAAAANWPNDLSRQPFRALCRIPLPGAPWTIVGKTVRGLPQSWGKTSLPTHSNVAVDTHAAANVAMHPSLAVNMHGSSAVRSLGPVGAHPLPNVAHASAMHGFRGYNGFAGAWEDWCDAAANIWPDKSATEDLRTKCKSQPLGPLSFAPYTDAGKLVRGLPAEFSSDPAIVQGGAAAAIWGSVKNVQAPPVNPTSIQQIMQGQPPATTPATNLNTVAQQQGGVVTAQQAAAAARAKQSSNMTMYLVIGGSLLAAGGIFLATRRKRGPVAGYAGYKRSRRRSKR
jgi:LPXTG-motif cell wall-anchored protein